MSSKRHERTCMCCGKKYEYCSHCNDFDPTETWKYLYHDKKCMGIAEVWYAYRGKEITKEEAKARMSEFKPNIDDVLKYNSIAAKEIREIFDIKEVDENTQPENNELVNRGHEEKQNKNKEFKHIKYGNNEKTNK